MFEMSNKEIEQMVSQNVIPSKGSFGGAKPFCFTEQGITMLSCILNSKTTNEMKKVVTLILIVIVSTAVNAQSNTNKIQYIFRDAVENWIDSTIMRELHANKSFKHYLFLSRDSAGFSVTVCRYVNKDSSFPIKLAKYTSRYAVVRNQLVPLISDYDEKFTSPSSDIGEFGKRDGNIIRSYWLFHNPILRFDLRGRIREEK